MRQAVISPHNSCIISVASCNLGSESSQVKSCAAWRRSRKMAATSQASLADACSLLGSIRSKSPRRSQLIPRLSPLSVNDWVQAAKSVGTPSLVCEVNFETAQVALSFLCHFPRSKYVGIDFRNQSRRDRRLLEQHLSARAGIVSGDDMRSVRVAPALDECDVLVLGTDDGNKGRKRLMTDLPNALRRAAPRSTVVMHGRACRPSQRMKANIRPSCTRASCTMYSWCQRWQELLEAGVLQDARCQNSTAGRRWCAGKMQPRSICTRRPPLLEGITGSAVRFGVSTLYRHAAEHLPGPWRYFTVRPCSPRETVASGSVCLFFKDGVVESLVGGVESSDGLQFPRVAARHGDAASGVGLVLPRKWRRASMTHNLAIAIDREEFVLIGGLFNPQHEAGAHANDGVWTARASSWQFMTNATSLEAGHTLRASGQSGHWRDVRRLLTGHHPGCVERRDPAVAPLAYPYVCEFDGRFSLVWFDGRYLLYGRANPGLHGERYVQVTTSTDMRSWSAFELIDVRGYHHSQGDMYFFSVQVNPTDPRTLVAMVPLVHRLRGCIGLTVSRDGLRWSEITPLTRCAVYGERTAHHPVDGLIVGAEHVDVYIHENVPGVTADRVTDRSLHRFPYLRQPASRIVRYRVPKATWSGWTNEALRSL